MAVLKILVLFLLIENRDKFVASQTADDYDYYPEETSEKPLIPSNELTHVRTKNLSGNVKLTTLQILPTNTPLNLNNENISEDYVTTTNLPSSMKNKQEVQTIPENGLLSEVSTKAPTDGTISLDLMDVSNSTSGTWFDQTTTEKLIIVTPLKIELDEITRSNKNSKKKVEDGAADNNEMMGASYSDLGISEERTTEVELSTTMTSNKPSINNKNSENEELTGDVSISKTDVNDIFTTPENSDSLIPKDNKVKHEIVTSVKTESKIDSLKLEISRENIEDLSSFMSVDEELLDKTSTDGSETTEDEEAIKDLSLILKEYDEEEYVFPLSTLTPNVKNNYEGDLRTLKTKHYSEEGTEFKTNSYTSTGKIDVFTEKTEEEITASDISIQTVFENSTEKIFVNDFFTTNSAEAINETSNVLTIDNNTDTKTDKMNERIFQNFTVSVDFLSRITTEIIDSAFVEMNTNTIKNNFEPITEKFDDNFPKNPREQFFETKEVATKSKEKSFSIVTSTNNIVEDTSSFPPITLSDSTNDKTETSADDFNEKLITITDKKSKVDISSEVTTFKAFVTTEDEKTTFNENIEKNISFTVTFPTTEFAEKFDYETTIVIANSEKYEHSTITETSLTAEISPFTESITLKEEVANENNSLNEGIDKEKINSNGNYRILTVDDIISSGSHENHLSTTKETSFLTESPMKIFETSSKPILITTQKFSVINDTKNEGTDKEKNNFDESNQTSTVFNSETTTKSNVPENDYPDYFFEMLSNRIKNFIEVVMGSEPEESKQNHDLSADENIFDENKNTVVSTENKFLLTQSKKINKPIRNYNSSENNTILSGEIEKFEKKEKTLINEEKLKQQTSEKDSFYMSNVADSLVNYFQSKSETQNSENEKSQISVGVNGKIIHFSLAIKDKETTFFVPANAFIVIRPNFVNITWSSPLLLLNNSLEINLDKSIELNIVKGTQRHTYKNTFSRDTGNKFDVFNKINSNDRIQIYFSNIELLKTVQKNQSAVLANALPSMPIGARTFAAEITGGCLGVLAITSIGIYYAIKKFKEKRNHFKPDNNV